MVAGVRAIQGNFDIFVTSRDATTPFTFGPAIDIYPIWLPDASRIIFSSDRNGVFNLFEKPTNMGTDERIVWESPDNKFPQDTSPDGRVLLYVNQDATTDDDLWALPLEGERKPFSILQTAAAEDQAQFSPDGMWIAYRSNESGRREIYVRPFPGPGSQKRVSEGGGIQPRWRSDGKELFYIRSDNQLIAVPIHLSSETKTLEAGKQTPLFEVRLGNPHNAQFGYDVAADGQSFIIDIAQGDPTLLPLTIVQNWKNALKK